jgi:hypothetical protein
MPYNSGDTTAIMTAIVKVCSIGGEAIGIVMAGKRGMYVGRRLGSFIGDVIAPFVVTVLGLFDVFKTVSNMACLLLKISIKCILFSMRLLYRFFPLLFRPLSVLLFFSLPRFIK